MNATQINAHVISRFAAVQTPIGRWYLNSHVRGHRVILRLLLSGGEFAKRAFDVVAGLLFLLLFSPCYGLIALLVKLDGGPVFFNQIRVGRHGREFKMHKFRSMCPDAEARLASLLGKNHHSEGVTFKLKDDPRLTRVGKWLRRLSLDELPQFFNVLVGDMSIVGPRPPVPREVSLYSMADRRRLSVKPGITCIWQVSGRSEIDFSGQVMLDVDYIETRNLWVDVKILARTVPAVLGGRGAC